jgi:hypothetical protein
VRRLIAGGAIWLLLFPGVAGCAPTDIKWTEEVKLHDGNIIQVQRRTELSATGFPTQKRGLPRYHELCYAPMAVYWKSKPEYRPETFDIVKGKAYVRVPLRGCSSCMLHGYPETNSLYFVWDGKEWKRTQASGYPEPLRLNLLSASHADDDGTRDARGLVSLAEKERRDASLYYELKVTGAKSTSERPGVRDLCSKCRSVDVRTDATPEVFMPSAKSCSW